MVHYITLLLYSAGIGPSAVLLSVIMGLEQGQIEGSIDTMATVNKLRSQRMNMVQTEVCTYYSGKSL